MKKCCLCWLLLQLTACSWFAGPAESASEVQLAKLAISQQRYAEAKQMLLPLTEQQQAPAQYLMGTLYQYGLGVKKSDIKAAGWYRLAAKQGYSAAAFDLGYLYRAGLGVDRNYGLARYYYEIVAQQEHSLAQLELADMYKLGLASPTDLELAKQW